MNKENVLKWVEALESGEYQQGTGVLTRVDDEDGVERHCCLGVACLVAMNNGVEVKKTISTYMVSYNGSTGTLPNEVRDWLGFDNGNPYVGRYVYATAANDSLGWNFQKIAQELRALYLSE